MIVFKWRPYQTDEGKKYIDWEATWDGKHDDWCGDPGEVIFPEEMHPFSLTIDFEQKSAWFEKHKDDKEDNPLLIMNTGDVVADNAVTRALCEILSDPKKNIVESGASGNSDPYWYYRNLLGCLSRLWD